MTSASPAPPLGARRCYRDTRAPVLGGVASGIAQHLAVPALGVRIGFLVAALLGGLGLIAYAALWLLLPSEKPFLDEAPGLAGARRDGRRPGTVRRLADAGPAVVVALLATGALLALESVLGAGTLFWPLALAAGGVALLWRQADEAQRTRWRETSTDPFRLLLGGGGWASATRIGAGLLLLMVALGLFAVQTSLSPRVIGDVLVAGLLAIAGVVIVLGPWLYRLTSDLVAERAERIRSQEREDMAAHLHDSVLQTLALIQKSAGDQATVSRLARSQERELRAWLFRAPETPESTLAAALRGLAASIEDERGLAVDVVTVGDTAYGERLRPLVEATREALANVAKHAGVDRVDLYAESAPGSAEVFVRDRGRGFDPDTVPADRQGLRHSIIDRLDRHGGRARVRSTPGEGTEVRLQMSWEDES